jgi:Flp pilus assembly protein CpaB
MRPRFLRRRRTRRTIIATAVTLVAAAALASALARAGDLADDFGERRVVAVATRDLGAGIELVDGDLRWTERPLASIGGTVTEAPAGRMVVEPVLEGEAVVDERLAAEGAHGPTALAPAGSRALAVPTPAGRPPLVLGDRLDVVAATPDGSTARRVARDAVVVAVDDENVTVAVAGDELGAVARAVLDGTAVLALKAPG